MLVKHFIARMYRKPPSKQKERSERQCLFV